MTVSCRGTLPASGSMPVTLKLAARRQGCSSGSATTRATVPLVCCLQGTSYPRRTGAGRASTCFQHVAPNETASCTGPAVWGLYNRGAANGTMHTVQARGCSGGVDVGAFRATCNAGNTIMTLQASDYRQSSVRTLFWAGCAVPATASQATTGACNQWQVVPAGASSSTNATFVSRTWTVPVPRNATTGRPLCGCSNLYWTVAKAGLFAGMPRC